MKKISNLIAAAATIFSIAGCSFFDVDSLPKSVMDIGELKQNVFISDDGVKYNISANNVGSSVRDYDRVILVFDILNEIIKEKEFNIKVTDLYTVKCANPVMSNPSDKDPETGKALGHDPVRLASGWSSGGYLNMEAMLFAKSPSTVKHQINLEYKGIQADTLRFELRHNAFGEIPVDATGDFDDRGGFEIVNSFFSFPVSHLIPAGLDSYPASIENSWYVKDNEGAPLRIEKIKTIGDVFRTGTAGKNMRVLK